MDEFECFKCKLKYKLQIPVIVIDYKLCSSCASKFIETLANWKDFMQDRELYFWVTGKDYDIDEL